MNKGYRKVAFLFRSAVKKDAIFERTLFIFFVLLEDGLDHTLLQDVGNSNAYKFAWWTNCCALKALDSPQIRTCFQHVSGKRVDVVYVD